MYEKIRDYFKAYPQDFEWLLIQSDYLDDCDVLHQWDEFNDMFYDYTPCEIMEILDHSTFSADDEYFTWDGYGIITYDEKDYSDYLDDVTIEYLAPFVEYYREHRYNAINELYYLYIEAGLIKPKHCE